MIEIKLEEILPHLSLQNQKKYEDYYSFSCPFHKEKNNSFVLYNNGFGKCFACNEQTNIYKLTKFLTGKSVYQILNIKNTEYRTFLFNKENNRINESIKKKYEYLENKSFVIKGKLLNVFDNEEALSYLRQRNITNEIIKDFNIKCCNMLTINNTFLKDRIIIPIYENNKIIAYEARDYTRKQEKKVIYPRGSSVNSLLNIDNLNKKELLHVVEGFMDIPLIYSYISKNVTCLFGASITKRQIELLNEFEVCLIPDIDSSGENTISILDKMLDKEFYIAKLKKSKDCGEANLNEIKEAIDNKVLSNDYMLNKYDMKYKNIDLNW